MIIGRLGQDPEVRSTPNGATVCNLSVATNESYNDKQGMHHDKTEWHRIVVWGRQAEACGQFLKKGREVFIEGKLTSREWTDKQGASKTTIEVIATNIVFLSEPKEPGELPKVTKMDFGDDIPF